MKLLSIPRQRRDCFPYVITPAFGGFVRNRMDLFVSGGPGTLTDGFDAAAVGYDGPGHVAPAVRKRLLDFFSQRARRSGSSHCVVFGEYDCVHVLPDGTTLIGHMPPRADTLDAHDFDVVPYPLIDLWHIALPEGSAAKHLASGGSPLIGSKSPLAHRAFLERWTKSTTMAWIRPRRISMLKATSHRRRRIEAQRSWASATNASCWVRSSRTERCDAWFRHGRRT